MRDGTLSEFRRGIDKAGLAIATKADRCARHRLFDGLVQRRDIQVKGIAGCRVAVNAQVDQSCTSKTVCEHRRENGHGDLRSIP